MPAGKLYRYKRKTKRRKKYKKKSTLSIPRNLPYTVPANIVVRMRYSQSISVDPASGLAGSHVYRASSIFDPDQTGVGGQPKGHDEWANFYSNYVVLGSKVTAVAFSRSDTASTAAGVVCAGIRPENTAVTSGESVLESQGFKVSFISQGNGSKSIARVTNTYSPKAFFGIKDTEDNLDLTAAFGANPTSEAYFYISLVPSFETDNMTATPIWVTIDYTTRLSGRRSLGVS